MVKDYRVVRLLARGLLQIEGGGFAVFLVLSAYWQDVTAGVSVVACLWLNV